MKLEPLKKQMIGRLVLTKREEGNIILAEDPTKGVSKFVLLEAVSPEAEAEGHQIGDFVLPKFVNNIFLKGGRYHRVVVSTDDVVARVRGTPLSEFTDNAGNPLNEAEIAADRRQAATA